MEQKMGPNEAHLIPFFLIILGGGAAAKQRRPGPSQWFEHCLVFRAKLVIVTVISCSCVCVCEEKVQCACVVLFLNFLLSPFFLCCFIFHASSYVQDSQGVSTSEITCIVSDGAFNCARYCLHPLINAGTLWEHTGIWPAATNLLSKCGR